MKSITYTTIDSFLFSVTLQFVFFLFCSVTMSVLISTLQEELANARRLEKKYRASLEKLPQGSFIVRRIKNKQYGYLTRREKGRVIQEYLGLMGESSVAEYREKNQKKKNYKEQLKKVREQVAILERALRGQAK